MNKLRIPYPNCEDCGDELTEGEFNRHENVERVMRRKEVHRCYQCNVKQYRKAPQRYQNR